MPIPSKKIIAETKKKTRIKHINNTYLMRTGLSLQYTICFVKYQNPININTILCCCCCCWQDISNSRTRTKVLIFIIYNWNIYVKPILTEWVHIPPEFKILTWKPQGTTIFLFWNVLLNTMSSNSNLIRIIS